VVGQFFDFQNVRKLEKLAAELNESVFISIDDDGHGRDSRIRRYTNGNAVDIVASSRKKARNMAHDTRTVLHEDRENEFQ